MVEIRVEEVKVLAVKVKRSSLISFILFSSLEGKRKDERFLSRYFIKASSCLCLSSFLKCVGLFQNY